mmetsp:Transcript_5431/g.13595  ORF Transcript_5431/g.13595 Transcript_5431/m.13595 type:complete len:396 (-) Transcript_5431:149-1336(-)
MVSLGKYLRWLCVVSWISYQIYFIVHGLALLKNKEGEMAGIFTCDISDDIMGMMTECAGLDDITTCGAAGAQCVRSSCGRPLFPHIGVSFAGSSDPFDADSATSTESFVTSLSLLYSLVPYILLIYFSIYLLAFGNVVPLTRLGLMGFISLVNDALLKNLVKQPRPTGSCLYFHSYGMPSGHAATSIGLVTFMLLELLLYHPNLLGKENLTMSATCDVEDIEGGSSLDVNFLFTWGHGWHKRTIVTESNSLEINKISAENPWKGADKGRSLLPSSRSISREIFSEETMSSNGIHNQPRGYHLQSKWFHHYTALLWLIVLLPVPLSRVHLHDHSPMQILTGSLVGISSGCFWYFCIVRGWFLPSSNVNSREIMAYLVNCRIGKWIGLNSGVDHGKI